MLLGNFACPFAAVTVACVLPKSFGKVSEPESKLYYNKVQSKVVFVLRPFLIQYQRSVQQRTEESIALQPTQQRSFIAPDNGKVSGRKNIRFSAFYDNV
jgi:hypothetical protein